MTSPSVTVNTNDDSGNEIWFFVALCVITPTVVLTAALTWVAFSYGKIKRSVILAFTAPIFIITGIFWQNAISLYVKAWVETAPKIVSESWLHNLGLFLAQQAWLSVPVGILAGLAYSSWRWLRRARWQQHEFRLTPIELLRYRKTVKAIMNDKDTPTDGITLGVIEKTGARSIQTDAESTAHTLIIGGAGSGKTTTAMVRLRDSIKRGHGAVIVDLKGGADVPAIAHMYAERYGRKFQHWLIQDRTKPYEGPAPEGNAFYDPLAQGDLTRRADMVLELREWGESADVYRNLSQSYLQLLFAVLINNPRKDISTLEDAVDLFDIKKLQERAFPLAANPIFSSYVRSIDKLNDEKLSAMVKQNLDTNRALLETFLQSTAGPWLTLDDEKSNNISLLDAAYNGDVVVFSLDSSSYPKLSSNLANLIIQDLKTVTAQLRKEPAENPFEVFIDEFSAIGSDNIVGLINKSRDAKMPVTMATQTLGDLIIKNPAVKDQIMGIISSFIIHRANIESDAEVYAGLTGKVKKMKFRQSVEHTQNRFGGLGSGIGAGGGAVEETEEYRVMPTQIQNLNVGQMFYINTVKHRVEEIQCIPESETMAFAPAQRVISREEVSTDHIETFSPLSLDLTPGNPLISSTPTPGDDFSIVKRTTQEDINKADSQVRPLPERSEGTLQEDDFATPLQVNTSVLKRVFNDPQALESAEKANLLTPDQPNETRPSKPPLKKPTRDTAVKTSQQLPVSRPAKPSNPFLKQSPTGTRPDVVTGKDEFEF